MKPTGSPIIRLHHRDNVVIACRNIAAGETVRARGIEISARQAIPVGHKMAARRLDVADKVVKWGAPIGSCTSVVRAGDHVHGHNLRSDYIPSHTREAATGTPEIRRSYSQRPESGRLDSRRTENQQPEQGRTDSR